MRLFLDLPQEELFLLSTGIYNNYSWDSLPKGFLPVVFDITHKTSFVAFSESQYDDIYHIENAVVYIIDYNNLYHLSKGRIQYCIDNENTIFIEEPVIDETIMEDIKNNIGSEMLKKLTTGYVVHKTLNIKQLKNIYRDSVKHRLRVVDIKNENTVLGMFQELENKMNFYIRHSRYTENWPEPFIRSKTEDILTTIINQHINGLTKDDIRKYIDELIKGVVL